MEGFQVAAGSVVGREHAIAGRNNQDGYHIVETDEMVVAVVCDGCGSSPHSEVGAKLVSRWVAERACVKRGLLDLGQPDDFLEAVRDAVLHRIQNAAPARSYRRFVTDHFLCTVVGCVITEEITLCFRLGDGLIVANTCEYEGKKYPGNAPPYLAYNLLEERSFSFELVYCGFTSQTNGIILGTDGVDHLIAATNCPKPLAACLPGTVEPIPAVQELLGLQTIFENHDALRRLLVRINTPSQKPDWEKRTIVREPGPLLDDTTLVAIRRRS